MARASTTAENQSLSGLTGTLSGGVNVVGFVSLHVGDPGTNGANENASTGGYAAQPATWNAPASGAMTNSNTLNFTTAGTVADTYFSTRNQASATSATYGVGGALTSGVTATSITVAPGALSLTSS